jgi:hypothetical protein
MDHLSWLPSPIAITVTPAERADFEEDLSDVWRWYEAWTSIYLESLGGKLPPWIAAMAEYGLRPHEVETHRAVAAAGVTPLSCRLEYMYWQGRRYIAEAQWVSGGLGFFIGIDSLYRSFAPPKGHHHLGALETELIQLFGREAEGRGRVLLVVRDDWLPGERLLAQRAAAVGVSIQPVNREECAELFLSSHARSVGLVYGQGYTQLLPEEALRALSRRALDGEIWTEAPFNYLYRQKWGLSLLHTPEFAARFPTRLQAITPVTILLNRPQPNFELISKARPSFHMLSEASCITDILLLPERVRSDLIVKCGAGVGGFHSNGRGVFRLTGSRGSVRKIISFVQHRMSLGEPWILQPFSSSSISLPAYGSDQAALGAAQRSHLKVMTFGVRSRPSVRPTLAGAISNFGKHWKVGGRKPGKDSSGNEMGTSFTDVLVSSSNVQGA